MSVFSMAGGNPALPTYPLQRSVRLRSSASAYFNRTLTTPTSNTTWTLSLWVKRGALSTNQALISAGTSEIGYSVTTDTLKFYAAGPTLVATSTPVYRDPSAWGHWVIVSNGTTVVAYYNNVSVLSYTGTLPQLNSAIAHNIGKYAGGSSDYFDGYLTEVNFIDGQALTPSSFGAYNSYGVWSPVKYTGTYGTNGFYLNFQDNSALTTTANVGIGKDSSGQGNYWTSNGINVTAYSGTPPNNVSYDSMLDVPTLTSNTNANFAVFNPTIAASTGVGTITNGNLQCVTPTTGASNNYGTIGMTSGKWYWEVVPTSISTNNAIVMMGIGNNTQSATEFYSQSGGYAYRGNGERWNNGSGVAYGSALSVNDVIGIAFNADARTIEFYRNGSSMGVAYSSIPAGEFFPAICDTGTTVTWTAVINFGQRPFSYTPPTGFNSLNTYNLPDSIVPVGAQYFAATTYTGTGATRSVTNTVNGFSMQPDFVWIKGRSLVSNNALQDAVRGATLQLSSNLTAAEITSSGEVTAFNSNGFSVGNDASGYTTNANGSTYVGWQWRASNASAVTNTSGSITSSVSANQTAGFSIVTYTGNGSAGATVGHGLGVAPKMIILKNRSNATGYSWPVMHTSLPANGNVFLNLTQAYQTTYTTGGIANPANSSTFGFTTTSTLEQVNANTNTYVAYCFAAVPGYSAFGSYTGNGSTDGPFVFTGFLPRFVLTKRSDSTGPWQILDSSRDTYNSSIKALFPNTSGAEANFTQPNGIDFLSNGFKLRNTSTDDNASGGTYIYAAFAENPFKNSLAR